MPGAPKDPEVYARWIAKKSATMTGRRHSPESLARMSEAAKERCARQGEHERMSAVARKGERNPRWKGSDAGSSAVHLRLSHERGSPAEFTCAMGCGRQAAEWAFQWRRVPQEQWLRDGRRKGPFTHNLLDFDPLCKACHRRYDLEQH